MNSPESRAHLFQTALRQAGWTVQQLWMKYLALGGIHDVFDLESFLHDLAPLDAGQQNVLAVAVNERLDDLYQAARVPYLSPPEPDPGRPTEDPLQVLHNLLPEPFVKPDSPEPAEEEPV